MIKKKILLFVLLLSCSEKEMTLDEKMAVGVWDEINGYKSWTQPGNFSGIQESNSAHGNYVQIWLNEISSEFLHDTTAGEIMPSGSIIIKEAYSNILGEYTTGITVMKKITDYDPTHNDWFWVSYKFNGSLAGKNGAEEFCYSCHHSGKDYVLFNGQ